MFKNNEKETNRAVFRYNSTSKICELGSKENITEMTSDYSLEKQLKKVYIDTKATGMSN